MIYEKFRRKLMQRGRTILAGLVIVMALTQWACFYENKTSNNPSYNLRNRQLMNSAWYPAM